MIRNNVRSVWKGMERLSSSPVTYQVRLCVKKDYIILYIFSLESRYHHHHHHHHHNRHLSHFLPPTSQ